VFGAETEPVSTHKRPSEPITAFCGPTDPASEVELNQQHIKPSSGRKSVLELLLVDTLGTTYRIRKRLSKIEQKADLQ
jgi:hypothetical protein